MRRFSLCLLWSVLALCVAETAAQAEVNIILYRDDDSLTLQILGNGPTPLADLRFEIAVGQAEPIARRLDSYPLFQRPLQSGEVFAPLCLRLERAGSQGLIPSDCQTMNLVIQELQDSEIFWRDAASRRPLVVSVYAGAALALCGPQDASCLFSYRREATESTPVIQASPSVRLGLSGMPVLNNDSWLRFIQEFEGVEMALVPVGCFLMGAVSGQENEAPLHEICFEQPFWIDRTEVTNIRYGGYGWWTESERPREVVSWGEARSHCEGRAMRLPSEAEWEYAARGPDNLVYPWGSDFDPARVTFGGSSSRQTGLVGERPNGASWVGALDMSGNVWEWVSTMDRPYPYDAGDGRENLADLTSERIMRGGSWMDDGDVVTATFRRSEPPEFRLNNVGFRCARDYRQRTSTC